MKNLSKIALFSIVLLTSATSSFAIFGRKTETTDGNTEMDLAPYTGIKHAIGVIPFENTSYFKSSIDLQENMTIMMENALLTSGRFVVVERENLDATLTEQNLQASGMAAGAANVAQSGQIRSAKYLARCSITGVESDESGTDGGIRVGKFAVGAGGGKAQIEMIVKIFDSSTSEIKASQRIVGKAGKRKLSLAYTDRGMSTKIGGFSKTPIGEAANDCVAQAVEFVASQFEDYDFEGTVVTVTGDGTVVLNRGTMYNVAVGDKFQVREVGEVLVDPSTGEVLDRLEGGVSCTIEVTRVSEKVSYCKVIDGEIPVRGDSATRVD